jgi:hypothetical protein
MTYKMFAVAGHRTKWDLSSYSYFYILGFTKS